MVFDNADDPQLSLSAYFPTGDRGDIIITSRNPGCRLYETVGYCEVGSMQDSDSHALLSRIIYGNSSITEEDKRCGKEIVSALGHLALAVTQAGAYIRETMCTPNHYLELYRHRRQDLLGYDSRHSGTDYRYTVFTTWQVSLDRIESIQDGTSAFALEILRLVCFYHHDRVPLALWERAWRLSRAGKTPVAEWSLWPKTIWESINMSDLVYKSTALLASFSLIHRDLGGSMSLSLHPLVYYWCRARLSEQEQRSSCSTAIQLLAASFAWDDSDEDHTYQRSVVPHVQACLQAYYEICGELDDETDTNHWSILGESLSRNGFNQDALDLSEKVLRLYKINGGDEHPGMIHAMRNLAVRYRKTGQNEEALRLSKQVLELSKSEFGEDDIDTISYMHDLVRAYLETSQPDKALQLSKQVVEFRKTRLGNEHRDTIDSMHDLALCYGDTGQIEEALQLSEEIVQLYKDKLGGEHPDTIGAMHNLAALYRDTGRVQEALKLTNQTVQLCKKKLGEEHPVTIISIHLLALCYRDAGEGEEALRLMEQTARLSKDVQGDEHPQTIGIVRDLALVRTEVKQNDEAQRQVEQHTTQLKRGESDNDRILTGDQPPHRLVVPQNLETPLSQERASSSKYGFSRLWRKLHPRDKHG